jgi:hypothetical protein
VNGRDLTHLAKQGASDPLFLYKDSNKSVIRDRSLLLLETFRFDPMAMPEMQVMDCLVFLALIALLVHFILGNFGLQRPEDGPLFTWRFAESCFSEENIECLS